MLRTIGFAVAALLCAPAFAQNYAGTFTTTNQQGGIVKGTLTGNNNSFQVEAKATPRD